MIRPLRQRHRHMIVGLGVFLPLAFAAGIVARKPVPGMTSLPKELAVSLREFAVTEWERADLFTKTPIQVRLLRERTGVGRFAVGFSAPKNFAKPDLIVYWVAGISNLTETVPDTARLLGAFHSSSPLPLPVEAVASSGMLVFYSLADHEILETSKAFELR